MTICKCGATFKPTFAATGRAHKYCADCRAKQAARQLAWRERHGRPSTAQYQREFNLRRRLEAFDAYGRECRCCGETRWQFLSFDHTSGGGVQHRKEIATRGNGFVSWLHANGFPDGIRVLCHNCNAAMGYYGACPHAE